MFGGGLSRGSFALTMRPTCGGGSGGARFGGSSVVRFPESLRVHLRAMAAHRERARVHPVQRNRRDFEMRREVEHAHRIVLRTRDERAPIRENHIRRLILARQRIHHLTGTGSIPTAISRISTGKGFAGFDTSKTERRPAGVFTAKSRVPSGERQMGGVWCDSKFTYCARSAEAHKKAHAPNTNCFEKGKSRAAFSK